MWPPQDNAGSRLAPSWARLGALPGSLRPLSSLCWAGGGVRRREGMRRMGRSQGFVDGHRLPHLYKHVPIFALNIFFF